MIAVGMFVSIWTPFALAEATSQLHAIMRSSNASHEAQVFKKDVDKAFIIFCIVTNIIRSVLWAAWKDGTVRWATASAYQHFYLGVELTTILNIGSMAMQLNLAEHQNQAKVDISLPDLSTCLLSRSIGVSRNAAFSSPRAGHSRGFRVGPLPHWFDHRF